MKTLIVTICLLFCGNYLFAQDTLLENKIKELEQSEVRAVLNKDTLTLKNLWDKDFVVNNPEGKIVLAKNNSVDRPVLQRQRTFFTGRLKKLLSMVMLPFRWGKKLL